MYSMEVNERYDILEYIEEDDEEREVPYTWKSYNIDCDSIEEAFKIIKDDGGRLDIYEGHYENGYVVKYYREFDDEGLDYVYGYVVFNKKGGKLSIHDINIIKKVFGV